MADKFLEENRYLYIESKLGPNELLLESFTGNEGISQLFSSTVDPGQILAEYRALESRLPAEWRPERNAPGAPSPTPSSPRSPSGSLSTTCSSKPTWSCASVDAPRRRPATGRRGLS